MEKGFPAKQSDADCVLRCSWLDVISWQMVEASNACGVPIVDLHAMFRGGVDASGRPDGTATKGTTWDSTHFTPGTIAAIEGACSPLVGQLFPT